MASTTAAPQQPPATPAPGKLKRIIVIATIAVIAALGAAAATYFFLLKDGLPHGAPAKPAALPAPIFFALDPMTVNLQSDDGSMHYLRIGLSLKLTDPRTQEHLTQHMPEIRSRILLALSNKHPDDLATLDGKRALAGELKTLIEKPTDPGGEPASVDDVLFTEFVVQ
jgi:flagellar FliL protein